MVSVARIVEKMIQRKPFLQEALSSGIINYGALAETMQQEVEEEFGKSVKHAAIMMALRRLQDKIGKMPIAAPHFTKDCDLTIKSDLFEMNIVRHPGTYRLMNKFYDLVDARSGDFFTVTTGMHEITIIASKKYKKDFLKLVKKEDILIIIDDIAAVTAKLPPNGIDMPGIFYLLTRALTWENINIVEIVSTYTEDTIFLRNKDVSRAYTILLQTMRENTK